MLWKIIIRSQFILTLTWQIMLYSNLKMVTPQQFQIYQRKLKLYGDFHFLIENWSSDKHTPLDLMEGYSRWISIKNLFLTYGKVSTFEVISHYLGVWCLFLLIRLICYIVVKHVSVYKIFVWIYSSECVSQIQSHCCCRSYA